MRKLRWLAIALAVMAAPAVYFFLSNLYFLASPDPTERKVRLLESTFESVDMRRYGGGWTDVWYDLFPSPMPRQVVVELTDPVPHKPSIWEAMPPCPQQDYSVSLEAPDAANSENVEFAVKAVERLPLRNAMIWVRTYSSEMQAGSVSVVGLATLDACIRATPFYSSCVDKLYSHQPTEEALVDRLLEKRILDRQEDGLCWNMPMVTITNAKL